MSDESSNNDAGLGDLLAKADATDALPKGPIYVALIHYPVYDKHHRVVTSSVTNIDVHDISRSCRTYGVEAFYVVTPVDALRGLVRRIMKHWAKGTGSKYNPTRTEALSLVRLEKTLEGVEIDIERTTGRMPKLVATTAKRRPESLSYTEMRGVFAENDAPYLVLLGTGWGMTDEIFERSGHVLAPLDGPTDYNHLSVRAAAAIILDRLLGKR